MSVRGHYIIRRTAGRDDPRPAAPSTRRYEWAALFRRLGDAAAEDHLYVSRLAMPASRSSADRQRDGAASWLVWTGALYGRQFFRRLCAVGGGDPDEFCLRHGKVFDRIAPYPNLSGWLKRGQRCIGAGVRERGDGRG